MVETRKDYRKKQRQKKFKNLWHSFFKTSKPKDEAENETDVPENKTFFSDSVDAEKQITVDEKRDRLKKRLNWAILIVLGLIILVLIALFKL
ncbi:hypothetical protein FP435_02780 [Lactobacillus sp. PV037]|uniref:hypothetical protein n=1 Tax=unclassified Lactobacillus TaxID=2620435 RepID=UPI00223FF691|nr:MULTISPECIES: hypothetical protein [unclassified Lactobacillus]QNQ82450.1 hypothetical protein FP433_05045 [Lactobacillus sp. PV012]QNQ83436.1 hypothetical protein FP435_02780 [Lactobacillus sp. PV037]